MISFRKPSADCICGVLATQKQLDFSYPVVGATAETPPNGFVLDHTRIKLGNGHSVFHSAKAALQQWQQFRLGWVEISPPDTPIEVGEVVAVIARTMCLWWLNCCRIVYIVDESGSSTKYGFAYGTLPGHVECGEERFSIEWKHDDDSVWYDIVAFSRPNHFLTRLFYPATRFMQKRFAKDSAAAMMRAVGSKD